MSPSSLIDGVRTATDFSNELHLRKIVTKIVCARYPSCLSVPVYCDCTNVKPFDLISPHSFVNTFRFSFFYCPSQPYPLTMSSHLPICHAFLQSLRLFPFDLVKFLGSSWILSSQRAACMSSSVHFDGDGPFLPVSSVEDLLLPEEDLDVLFFLWDGRPLLESEVFLFFWVASG